MPTPTIPTQFVGPNNPDNSRIKVGIVGVGIKYVIAVVDILSFFLSGLLFFGVGIAPVGINGQLAKTIKN